MKASQVAISYLKSTEEFIPQRKADGMNNGVQLYSIGYGHQISDKEKATLWNATLTKAQAEEIFKKDLQKFENAVSQGVKVPLTQNQFDALVIWGYNVGPGRLYGKNQSTLIKLINAQAQPKEIYTWWTSHYLTSGGVRMEGLVKRRKYEADLFFRSGELPTQPTQSTQKAKPNFMPYIAGAISVSLVGIGAYFYMKQ